MMVRGRVFAIALVAAVAATYCNVAFGKSASDSGRGTLVGGIVFRGDIPPGYAKSGYQRGLIQVVQRSKVVASTRVHQGHGYRFALTPGTYLIRTPGNAPLRAHLFCARSVKVAAATVTHADVICFFH